MLIALFRAKFILFVQDVDHIALEDDLEAIVTAKFDVMTKSHIGLGVHFCTTQITTAGEYDCIDVTNGHRRCERRSALNGREHRKHCFVAFAHLDQLVPIEIVRTIELECVRTVGGEQSVIGPSGNSVSGMRQIEEAIDVRADASVFI